MCGSGCWRSGTLTLPLPLTRTRTLALALTLTLTLALALAPTFNLTLTPIRLLEEWCLAHALLERQRRGATRVRGADEEGGGAGADEPLLLTLALALPGAPWRRYFLEYLGPLAHRGPLAHPHCGPR